MTRHIDIREFAQRVERVCDFFLDQVIKDGNKDVQILQDLKKDAVDVQSDPVYNEILEGLDEYVRGTPKKG